jgi:hypothetical protein
VNSEHTHKHTGLGEPLPIHLDVVPLWDIDSAVGFWKEYENILEAFIAAYISF